MTNYTLNTAAARQVGNSAYLREPGKYIGTFTRAEQVFSKQQTEGIEFSFKSREGQEAEYLTIWTKKADGAELYGFKVLMAIMACLKVKQITATDGAVVKRDASGQKTKVRATVFPDLMNKPIGLVLQGEEFEKQDMSVGIKLNIMVPFEAATELTAGEILDKKTTPQALAGVIRQLEREPVRKLKARAAYQAPAAGGHASPLDQMDDDLPF